MLQQSLWLDIVGQIVTFQQGQIIWDLKVPDGNQWKMSLVLDFMGTY